MRILVSAEADGQAPLSVWTLHMQGNWRKAMRHFHHLLASVLLALTSSVSHATAIERTVTVDITALGLPASEIPVDELYVVTPLDPFSVNTGDTLVLRYEFGGGRLRVVDSGAPSYELFSWNLFTDNFGKAGYTWKTSFYFEDVVGDLVQNSFVYSFGGPLVS